MSIKGTALKLGALGSVLLLFTIGLVVVFGQVRFDRTTRYTAEFETVSGLRQGQFVRASGVEVGKVKEVRLVEGGHRVMVDIDVDRALPLYQSTTAQIRYADLIGNRYLELQRGEGEGSDLRLPAGGFIPLAHTSPALDLDALIGGFKPVFRALDPDKINEIASSIVTVFQGQGGTISDILQQTAQLTNHIADRDEVIGQVVSSMTTVLDTAVRHRKSFDATVDNFAQLIGELNANGPALARGLADFGDSAGNLATLLEENHDVLHRSFPAGPPSPDRMAEAEDVVKKLAPALKLIGRTGTYGDFFNFYICDASLKLPGLQPGGPVRMIRLLHNQPSGRCTPQ